MVAIHALKRESGSPFRLFQYLYCSAVRRPITIAVSTISDHDDIAYQGIVGNAANGISVGPVKITESKPA
ncbi:hypothetical protein L596_009461 [Steinernema carpocapsae]|uniref:Uncharacterized protein n=1 Tax=Steinernema carpocapsae TaxID=34508 RepID=A0A4U5PFP6_STECR|nr:hypothetical protein L596_009461 [Steinernema carpocapsae]